MAKRLAPPQGEYAGFDVGLEDGVLTISFNRPAVGNALLSAAVPQLGALFRDAADRADIRVLLIRGEGESFCAGGDVKGFANTVDQLPEERRTDYWQRMDRAREQMAAFIALPCPVVVACQGAVAGAAVAYPLGADVALAEPGARFVFPHQRLALPPDGGLSYLLPRTVGVRKAIELTLTSAAIDAAEALRLGIITRIVPADEIQEEARRVARRLAAAPPESVRRAKQLLHASPSRTADEQLAAERDAVAEAVAGEDFVEGVRAFMEKRKPSFPSAVTLHD